ncbi:MAG: hypothetical protein M8867_11660 [marine benthic group bacterium]|nr:hypothetical protein [Gemmatimonadota bacterium]
MIRRKLTVFALVPLFACGPADEPATETASDAEPRASESSYGTRLGAVDVPEGCSAEATAALQQGLALLHNMTYEGSREAFGQAAADDPACALAHWGEAMTWIHPLWSDPPGEEEWAAGEAAIYRARELGPADGRSMAWIDAAAAYYGAGRGDSERPNLEALADGWQAAHDRYPEDREAAAFHALSQLALVDPADRTYAIQVAAGAVAESVLAAHPDHPGAHHYVIHAYDYPPLAGRAEAAARGYADVAPAVPHALHMPSHIFTRLGLWEESIDWNTRSAAAAKAHPAGDAISLHYLHALDYLAYARLQRAEDEAADEVAATTAALEGPLQTHGASAYTLAAVPARVELERNDWEAAAALEARAAEFAWDRFPQMEAITWFARGIGAARSDDVAAAREAAARLKTLRDAVPATAGYWATQVEIQRLAVEAWAEWAEGDSEEALATMQESADLEASTEKHPITPGEVLPARELYGDMLLEAGRYYEAIEAYEQALARSPNRFRSLYGAGRAAELAGDSDSAAAWYGQLLSLVVGDGEGRSEVEHARSVVGSA